MRPERAIVHGMLVYTYNIWMVALSFMIALMASFTGLTLSRGLAMATLGVRQLRIVLSSLALGGGIWSMHFVAILAMRFGIPVYFDVSETVASALIAMLMACLALLIVHFAQRTKVMIGLSGAILGLGITAMHFLGTSAIQGCTPVFSVAGFALAGVLSIVFGVAAMAVAFGMDREGGTLWATLIFGAAVTVVHFSAMSQTVFLTSVLAPTSSMQLGDSQIAIMVMLTVFVISGAFMLVGASFLSPHDPTEPIESKPAMIARPADGVAAVEFIAASALVDQPRFEPVSRVSEPVLRLPYERDGRTNLVPIGSVYALHAEGHYTTAYLDHGPVFCPWSVSAAEERLTPLTGFMRVHRSWIVNLALVTAYERSKDHGYCVMAGAQGLERVPVSRNRMAVLQEALGC